MWSALAHIGARDWRTHPLRLALTTLAVALGVGVWFAIVTANAALVESLARTVEQVAGRATLQVTAGESGFPETLLETVRATPGVALAEPVIEVVTHAGDATEGNLLILGVDTTGDQQLREYQFDRARTELADPISYLADPHSILVSRAFAARHGLARGARLPVYTAQGLVPFTVRGLIEPTGIGAVFGGNIAVMDIYSAQLVFGRGHNFDRIDLSNAPGTSVAELARRLAARLPDGVGVARPEVRGEALENAVTAMRLGMQITSSIALLVGVYIIFNSFTIAVNQRWRELGILRALGVSRGGIEGMLLAEAAAIGALGAVLGIAGGFVAAAGASRLMGGIAAAVYGTVATAVPPRLDFGLAATALALGLLASLGGAWLPARGAARLNPVLALHHIESRQRESGTHWLRILAGSVLVLASLALIERTPAHVGMTLEFGFAATLLAGFVLLMPLLVNRTARILRPLFARAGGPHGALAVDAMIESPRRSSATVGALMIGLMFIFSTAAYIQSYRHMIDRWTDQLLNADLFVATSALLRTTSYHFGADVGARIAALPGVRRVENVRFALIPYRYDSAAVIAIDMHGFLERAAGALLGARPGAVSALEQGSGLIVSRNFALRWGTQVGARLTLAAPGGALTLPVVALVDDYRSDKGSIFMDRALYERHWRDAAVDFVDVNLAPGANAAAVKQAIEAALAGREHALVYTNLEFRRWIASLVDQFFLLNYMQLVVAILVAVLGIADTLAISVAERRREFAILRALGAPRREVARLVLLEALAIAVVGVLTGALGALCNIEFMSHTVSTVLAGYDVPFLFPWAVVLAAFPAVALVALLAAWVPARYAMRTEVAEALGCE